MAHGEEVAADLLLSEGLREVFHFLCLINRRYAPIDRWLLWVARRLPVLADAIDPLVAQMRATTDVHSRLSLFAEIVTVLADYVYDNGLASRGEYSWADLPNRNPWWADLRETLTGDLKNFPVPSWVGVEYRYSSQFGLGGDFRELLNADG